MRFSPEKRFSLAARGALLAAFVLMVSHPALTFSQAAKALIVWYRSIVPTLLPVLIVSSLIVATRAWELLIPILHPIFGKLFRIPPCGSFSLLLGMLCGYPMGAKIVSDLYREGELSPKEARHLLAFTSFPSPMFLNGFLLHQCFNNSSLVIPFWEQFIAPHLSSEFFIQESFRSFLSFSEKIFLVPRNIPLC